MIPLLENLEKCSGYVTITKMLISHTHGCYKSQMTQISCVIIWDNEVMQMFAMMASAVNVSYIAH